jgi:hypothetical protein
MNRISVIRDYVDKIIENIEAAEDRKKAYIHTYGVAQCCSILAGKRGLDPELAYISGLLHDIYIYCTGSSLCHGQSGADMARVAIRHMDIILTEDEKVAILSAIFYHSNKDIVHDKYDEVLKDADVLHPFLNDSCSKVFYPWVPRLNNILKELNITAAPAEYGREQEKPAGKTFNKSIFADIAEEFAAKNICGEKDSSIFMDIVRYYPEDNSFDELKNYWCAAFVYHCALLAGLELPIRKPPFKYRFAGVGTWYEWGKANNICFYEKDGFVPSRGDIVIYNNIIPPENKPQNSAWHDHIGVVLACEEDYLVVAEGNIDNLNVSGVIRRKRNDTIGCFVRIPDDYESEDWKGDYKEYLRTAVKL